MHQPETPKRDHQQIRYRRSTALWKGSLCFLFLLLCVSLLWIIVDGQAERLETIYYFIAAVLGMWLIGPLFFMFVSRLTRTSAVLLSWNDDVLSMGKRKISWSQIRKVELASPARSKWLLSASPMIVLFLKDGTRSHIQTDHLLSKKELNQAVTLLQETLQEQKQDR
ncbi:hypothetical protein MHB85_05915 [Paenibacillus sp. FSL K6-4396]|uniref:hypothetical protein n=1 Tax=unclassified Paenibacillus TaxID=185978 RepID=UPI00177B4178|nr:hypothetical protein [Paenibacillus sp. CFBP 13594]MBD8838641.1 hypothetical protein [Paenibacillus sp. CFBP 13594]